MQPIYPDLAEKKIVVTGALAGIGRAIALNLAASGAHIVTVFRGDPSRGENLHQEIKARGGAATSLILDIAHLEETQEKIKNFLREHPTIDGLVNNAGIAENALALRMKSDHIDRVLDTNLKGVLGLTAALCRGLLKSPAGSLVHISSIVGLTGNTGQAAYAASKAGLIGFSKSLAKELAGKNIRSNVVCPGFISTAMTEDIPQDNQEKYKNSIPLGRFGQAQEIANLACFLLSNSSSYLTGEVIAVDGGLSM